MRVLGRNVLIAIASLIVAVFVSGAVQVAFGWSFPELYERSIGSTNVGTYVFLVALAISFFSVGARAPGWLRTSVPLMWMLFPVVAVYLIAIFGQPGGYRCNPFNTTYIFSCLVALSPFIVSAVAVVVGYFWIGRVRSIGRAV